MVEIQTLVLETWTAGGRLDALTTDAPILVCQLDGRTTLTTDPMSRRTALRMLESGRPDEEVRRITLATRRILRRVLRGFAEVHAIPGPLITRTTVDQHCGLLPNLLRRHPWRAWPPRAPGLYLSQSRHRRAWPLAELLDPPATWRYQLRAFLHRCYLSVEPIMAECLFVWRYVWLWLNLTWRWIRYGSEPADPSQFD